MAPIPGPDGGFYIGLERESEGDYFAEVVREYSGLDIEGLIEMGLWRENPVEPLSLKEIEKVLRDVARYGRQGSSTSSWCEGWNTHETANTATALCIWSLMAHAKHEQLNRSEAFAWINESVLAVTDGLDIFSGVDELPEMWTNESTWNDQFGPLAGNAG